MYRLLQCLALAITAFAALPIGAGPAQAQDDNTTYPDHPVRWLVGYPPGGSTDICARLIGSYLSQRLHQQFTVENKPGAGNNLATEMAAHSPPDGYTVFLVNPANAINASLYKNLNFDFLRDMAPVAGFIRVPNVMEVNPNVPAHTVAEFIDYAKANPGKVNMASAGIGTSTHLSGELFMMMTGVNLVHVPYRGAGPALVDMMGGQVQVFFDNMPSSIGYIRAGKLRALAVTTAERSKELPDVPTVAETVPGYEASAFFGMAVPAGTPRDIVELLNRAVNDALADPDVQAKLAQLGGTLIPGTPEDFGKLIADETDKWGKVVKATGATAE
ncbi:MAG TPA: tripartite tricarboxylate transporter substrate binding protein [Xanthobacteraceae bacterium]|jgi:tripartite-type tricarboxylate transporter receptor subunit TctC|nr:tripartite tricarboxylate transporter substrate binding protein [Xanthobacteraceae bacterium]